MLILFSIRYRDVKLNICKKIKSIESEIMKIYPDHSLIKKFTSLKDENEAQTLLNSCRSVISNSTENDFQFILDRPALFEYLGFSSLFENFQKPSLENPVFSSVIEVLKLDSDKEVIIYLFDQIFVECLTQVKAIPQILPKALLEQIQSRRDNTFFSAEMDPFTAILRSFERSLVGNVQETVHDLTLYLAWDRMCVYLAAIFDEPSLKIQNGLEILHDCLIESFQHILGQGRTTPSFFRLMEALYAYQMKDENLQKYSATEWQLLSQSVNVLQPRDYLPDACYIDARHAESEQKILTFENHSLVSIRLSLAHHMIGKLQTAFPDWKFSLLPLEIVCLKENADGFVIDNVICV